MATNPGSDGSRAEARLAERRSLYQGFGNALALAVEIAGVPIVFVLLGRWLDLHLDAAPAFTVALGVVAVVGVALRSYYSYQERMRLEEEGKPWARPRP